MPSQKLKKGARYRYREQWLTEAAKALEKHATKEGYDVKHWRVTVSWPSQRAGRGTRRVIGQCFYGSASGDGTHEILISPKLEKGLDVLEVIAHEMAHIIAGPDCGHKGMYPEVGRMFMLNPPWTSTTPSVDFKRWANPVLAKLGTYPHAELDFTNTKKQKTRMVKFECSGCGWIGRASSARLEQAMPLCGDEQCSAFGEAMDVSS